MSSGRILVNGSDFYCGSGANSLCQLALKTDVGSTYVHPSEIQCNAASEISSLKSSVSSGKSQIASAITGKGVSTSSSASFSTMASNISSLTTATKFQNTYLRTYEQDESEGTNSATVSIPTGATSCRISCMITSNIYAFYLAVFFAEEAIVRSHYNGGELAFYKFGEEIALDSARVTVTKSGSVISLNITNEYTFLFWNPNFMFYK